MEAQKIGLGVDVQRIHIIIFAARFRVSTRSGTLADELAKFQDARNSMLVIFHAISAV